MQGLKPSITDRELVLALDSIREGLLVVDRDFRYRYVNRAAATHARLNIEDLMGHTVMECYPDVEQTGVFRVLERCLATGEETAMRSTFEYPDGHVGVFELRFEPCSAGVMILSIDVTESHHLEMQSRHSQKMEAIGRLAGSIAHDFNNSLSVILSHAALLLEDVRPIDPIRSDLLTIHRASERAAALTRQLLAFSRQQVMSPEVVDLNTLLLGTQQMIARLLGSDIEVNAEYDRTLPLVSVDAGQIDQVLMNLALNARDAMPNGGTLHIATTSVEIHDTSGLGPFEVKPGVFACIAISDTGSGMTPDVKGRIFEPFFTTKERDKGTGLGLSTVFGIVKQSHGFIDVTTAPGQGSTFRVYFPETQEPCESPASDSTPPLSRGTETILLVEDEADVRKIATRILRRHGYHVLETSNAGEALLTSELHPHPIHLLLTDVVIPKLSGPALAQRLIEQRPEMRVLFVSGTASETAPPASSERSAYLQKPIEPAALLRRVREVLDGRERRSWHSIAAHREKIARAP